MATKAELEAEVEQLKAELASGIPPDVAVMTAELDKLKADLDVVVGEKDQAQANVATAADANKALLDEADGLKQQLDSIKKDLLVAQDALAQKPTAAAVSTGDENHAVIDGTTYDILWRSTVKDLVYEGYHKRHVDENQTAVVIAKVGG